MTEGQRAMAVATIYPKPDKAGRGEHKNTLRIKAFGVNPGYLSRARFVFNNAPDIGSLRRSGHLQGTRTPWDRAPIENDPMVGLAASTHHTIRSATIIALPHLSLRCLDGTHPR